MKALFLIALLSLFSCSQKQKDVSTGNIAVDTITSGEVDTIHEETKKIVSTFSQIADFPKIKDSIAFITELKEKFDLSHDPTDSEAITAYKKVKLYGSDKEYILIEFNYQYGSMSQFPWKYQLLFTTHGKNVATFSALRYKFIKIFPDKRPFLLTVDSTGKGNGCHQLYKITGDTIENVYDGVSDYFPRTYDIHEDQTINEPAEFRLLVKDRNNDGFNDIAFKGKIVYIEGQTPLGDWYNSDTDGNVYSKENPFKKLPVELIFLYNPKTGHFTQKEDYSKKYLHEFYPE